MNYLKFYRLKRAFTMQDMANFTGISSAKYRAIEVGEQTASDEVVQKIATKLNVSKEMLFYPVKYTIREMEGEVFSG